MADGFDIRELDEFTRDLLNMAHDLDNGKHSKKFLRKEGTKLRKETLKSAKSKVKKQSGNLFKGIKRGKVYKYDGDLAIRTYGSGNHTHLLNSGHVIKGKNGKEHGFKEGEHFFEEAERNFRDEYYNDVEDWIDDLLKDHNL
ncbi:hypothetical protein [Schinkia azotoformans]|uniref:hypothetical protein n=1 Tax=Schinkia azotoformans TaxID=1454 RepID=UPI002DC04404|nr:hypothetical protein [Schinkia azotoformans]MEC1757381.1 hypothetical protein [Schinkia azotoformans]